MKDDSLAAELNRLKVISSFRQLQRDFGRWREKKAQESFTFQFAMHAVQPQQALFEHVNGAMRHYSRQTVLIAVQWQQKLMERCSLNWNGRDEMALKIMAALNVALNALEELVREVGDGDIDPSRVCSLKLFP
jgi:hypothetical protein